MIGKLPALAALTMLAPIALAARAPELSWPVVAYARDGVCSLTVTGDGKLFRLAARGLVPGAVARYRIANGAMPVLEWTVRGDAEGEFSRIYLPFLWYHHGATVDVAIDGAGCRLSTAFAWERSIRVID